MVLFQRPRERGGKSSSGRVLRLLQGERTSGFTAVVLRQCPTGLIVRNCCCCHWFTEGCRKQGQSVIKYYSTTIVLLQTNNIQYGWLLFSSHHSFSSSTRWTLMVRWQPIGSRTWCWATVWFWSRTLSTTSTSTCTCGLVLTTSQWGRTCRISWTRSDGPKRTTLRPSGSPERVRRWPGSCCSPLDCTATTTGSCRRTPTDRGGGRPGTQTWSWFLSLTTRRPSAPVTVETSETNCDAVCPRPPTVRGSDPQKNASSRPNNTWRSSEVKPGSSQRLRSEVRGQVEFVCPDLISVCVWLLFSMWKNTWSFHQFLKVSR